MTSARVVYAVMLREHVSPALRAAGCKGSAGRYELPSPTHWLQIGFQRSRWSSDEEVQFTVNCSVVDRMTWAAGMAAEGWPAQPSPNTSFLGPPWEESLGQLMPDVGEDVWWSLRADQDPAPVGAVVARAIAEHALPVLRTLPAPPAMCTEPAGPPTTVAPREDFAETLWRYGEQELAVAMLDADDATFLRVMIAASDPQQWTTQASMAVDTLMALGAVEVLDGPRPLQRRRRRPEGAADELWQRVGRHQDRREDGVSLMEALRLSHGF